MKQLAIGIFGATAVIGLAMVAGLVVVVAAVGGGVAAGSPANTTPTDFALHDIPPALLPAYRQAASRTCSMPWTVLAGVGKEESDHGRSSLPGVHGGTSSAGAAGPMQFLSATWAVYGVDGNGDGRRDVYDAVDAIWGAAHYLCANSAGDPTRLRTAIWNYNHADWYVDDVLRWAARYGGLNSGPQSAGTYGLPVDRSVFDAHPEYLTLPHHDYPAIDIPVPVGSPVYAVTTASVTLAGDDGGACGNTVLLAGGDGFVYTYCHLSVIAVEPGQTVEPGAVLGLSGGAVGSPGAGSSTGPHLHLGVKVGASAVCAQTVLSDWYRGVLTSPAAAPSIGCVG